MKNSYQFFENRECKYFPCHKGLKDFNCLFCYCPMYHFTDCLGSPEYREKNGKRMKICTNCNFPHQPEYYEQIIRFLKEH